MIKWINDDFLKMHVWFNAHLARKNLELYLMCNYLTIDFSLSPNFPCFFLIESDPTFFKRHIVRENCSNLRVRIESKPPSVPLYADNNQQFLEFRMILLHLKDLRKYLCLLVLLILSWLSNNFQVPKTCIYGFLLLLPCMYLHRIVQLHRGV